MGALVTVTYKDGSRQWQTVHSGSSYCSQSELALTFGLGREPLAKAVDVLWPSGKRQHFDQVPGSKQYTVNEDNGLTETP